MKSFCFSYYNTYNYDLITTYKFSNFFEVIKLKQICLHLQFSKGENYNTEKILVFFSFLSLISNQKPKVIKSKKIKFTMTFKGGMPVGCKVNLRKKQMYLFLDYFIFQVLGHSVHTKKTKFSLYNSSYRLILNNLFAFTEVNKKYIAYATLNNLNIDFFFISSSFSQSITFLNLLKLPL